MEILNAEMEKMNPDMSALEVRLCGDSAGNSRLTDRTETEQGERQTDRDRRGRDRAGCMCAGCMFLLGCSGRAPERGCVMFSRLAGKGPALFFTFPAAS